MPEGNVPNPENDEYRRPSLDEGPGSSRSVPPSDGPEPPGRMPIIDAVYELIETAVAYVRTQTEDIMRDKVVLPAQKLGFAIASATAAGCLFSLGVGFISVGLLILLAHFITWVGALCLIGSVLVIGAGVFTYLKVRSMQHDIAAEPAGQGKSPAPADAPGTPPSDPRRT